MMTSNAYAVIINDVLHGQLDYADPPRYWVEDTQPYQLRRWRQETGWQSAEYAYEVHDDHGHVIRGWVSQDDGIGVNLPDASWGFRQQDDGVIAFGPSITISINHQERRVLIVTPDGTAHLPVILCGLLMLLDPA